MDLFSANKITRSSDHATSNPSTTTPKRCWLVGIVVSTRMNHDRPAADAFILQMMCSDRQRTLTVLVDD